MTLAAADATSHGFGGAVDDLVFSRFGVMFFHDPVAGVRLNLRAALRDRRGEQPASCVRVLAPRRSVNPWMLVPIAAGRPLLPPVERAGPDEPGPFAFADPARVRSVLGAAGWRHVEIEACDAPFVLSRARGSTRRWKFSLAAGPLAKQTAQADEALCARVREAGGVCAALAPYLGAAGVMFARRYLDRHRATLTRPSGDPPAKTERAANASERGSAHAAPYKPTRGAARAPRCEEGGRARRGGSDTDADLGRRRRDRSRARAAGGIAPPRRAAATRTSKVLVDALCAVESGDRTSSTRAIRRMRSRAGSSTTRAGSAGARRGRRCG